MLAVDVAAVNGKHAEGIEAVKDARGFIVGAAGGEEELQAGRDGARIVGVEIDGLGNDEMELINSEAYLFGEVEEAERFDRCGGLFRSWWCVRGILRRSDLIYEADFAHAVHEVVDAFGLARHTAGNARLKEEEENVNDSMSEVTKVRLRGNVNGDGKSYALFQSDRSRRCRFGRVYAYILHGLWTIECLRRRVFTKASGKYFSTMAKRMSRSYGTNSPFVIC